MKHQTILFDTDIGTDVDDAFALIVLTHLMPQQNFAVITTNGPAHIRAQAALTLLKTLVKRNIPVFEGLSHSQSNIPAFVHGKEHIGVNKRLRPQTLTETAAWLKKQRDKSVKLVAIAPLTTTAWIISQKFLLRKISSLVIMGGSLAQTDIPLKEHNFSADPKAVQDVLKSNISLRLVPLNVTMQHKLRTKEIQIIHKSTTPAGKLLSLWMSNWLTATKRFPKEDHLFRKAVFLHDPLTVLAAIRPKKFRWKPACFTVDQDGVMHKDGNRSVFLCTKATMNAVQVVKQIIISSVRN